MTENNGSGESDNLLIERLYLLYDLEEHKLYTCYIYVEDNDDHWLIEIIIRDLTGSGTKVCLENSRIIGWCEEGYIDAGVLRVKITEDVDLNRLLDCISYLLKSSVVIIELEPRK